MDNNTCIRLFADHEQIKSCKNKLRTAQESFASLSNILALAGNEVRLKIVYLLEEEKELCPCDLSDILGISIPAVSQHLRKLKDGNIVETRKEGQTILAIVTVFAILMMTLPLYAKMFYPKQKVQATAPAVFDHQQQVKFIIQGMTCKACEEHVNSELSKVNGVLAYKTSYATRSSLVSFDKSKIDEKTIEAAINRTGYKVKSYQFTR